VEPRGGRLSGMSRRPGRPPLSRDDPSVDVHVTLSAADYDAAYQRARDRRESLPELIRRSLTQLLDADQRPDRS
jgi:hypothetical protein